MIDWGNGMWNGGSFGSLRYSYSFPSRVCLLAVVIGLANEVSECDRIHRGLAAVRFVGSLGHRFGH